MGGLRVMAVTSGKGGVGKSHLAANLATLASRQGQRVLLIDADAGLASLDTLLGVKPTLHLGDLLDGKRLDDILLPTAGGLWLLPAASGLQRLTRLSPEQRAVLFAAWDELAWRFDLVLLDCGPGVGEDVLFFATLAQQVILVANTEPTSVSDAAMVVKALGDERCLREVLVVVNHARTDRTAHAVFAKLCTVASEMGPAAMSLRYLGSVPDDQNVRRATALARPLVTVAPHSPASRAFERIATALFALPVPRPSGGLTLGLERLMHEAHPPPPPAPAPAPAPALVGARSGGQR